ncbi:MAG: LacI family DNA-binding transcriptional regulator [Clostridia bacterium]|nr:LacI family DNA-binding transcriptional regulator [Clostridia bacterium]
MKRKGAEPTIKDVARRAGVSIATVSRVLNDSATVRLSTAQKVAEAMDALGYPRELPAAGRVNQLVIAVLPNLSNPFYAEIILGLQTSAKSHNLDVLLYPEGNVERHASQLAALLRMTNACGLILLSPVTQRAVLDELNLLAPLVQCAEYNEDSPLPYVGVDDISAARNATETLLRAGRRRIALINGPEKYKYARHRRQGYEEALRQAGYPVDPLLEANVTEMGFDSSMAVAQQMLLAKERPDAILAASDMYAAAVVKASVMAGLRIPQDLALISFDNTYISQMHHPSVTSVNLPRFQLGYMAMEVLAERMVSTASDEPKQFLLKTELVLRDSV